MTDAEADQLLAFLKAAGVTVDWFAFYVPGRRPVPPEVELWTIDPATWDAEFTLMWPVLPASDPRAAAVDQARHLFFTDPAFVLAMEDANGRAFEAWAERYAADEASWETNG